MITVRDEAAVAAMLSLPQRIAHQFTGERYWILSKKGSAGFW